MHLISKAEKVLCLGSTLTGDCFVTIARDVCRHFSAKGWRCVNFTKRGCGLTWPNTQPNQDVAPWCLSNIQDIQLAINHVAKLFPDFPICGIGLSTGAGQLRNYVNLIGEASKLSACVLVDAAPEWEWALNSVDTTLPLIAKSLGGVCKATFQECHRSALPCSGEAFEDLLSGGLMEFVRDYQAPAHGFEHSKAGASEYMRRCQPAPASGCAVPTLELMTINDSLITPEMCERLQDFHKASPHIVTATTVEGTHMIRWEGFRPTCWIARSSAEFLEAALQRKASAAQWQKTKLFHVCSGSSSEQPVPAAAGCVEGRIGSHSEILGG